MRQQYKNSYRFTKPPKVLLKARLDNIAIVPASMLPSKETLQELLIPYHREQCFYVMQKRIPGRKRFLSGSKRHFESKGIRS